MNNILLLAESNEQSNSDNISPVSLEEINSQLKQNREEESKENNEPNRVKSENFDNENQKTEDQTKEILKVVLQDYLPNGREPLICSSNQTSIRDMAKQLEYCLIKYK